MSDYDDNYMSFSCRLRHGRRRSVLRATFAALVLALAAVWCDANLSTALAGEPYLTRHTMEDLDFGIYVERPSPRESAIEWSCSIYSYTSRPDWLARSLRLMPMHVDEATHLALNATSAEIQDPLSLSSIPERLRPPASPTSLSILCELVATPSGGNAHSIRIGSRDACYQNYNYVEAWGQWYPSPGASRMAINAPGGNVTLKTPFIARTSCEEQACCEGR